MPVNETFSSLVPMLLLNGTVEQTEEDRPGCNATGGGGGDDDGGGGGGIVNAPAMTKAFPNGSNCT